MSKHFQLQAALKSGRPKEILLMQDFQRIFAYKAAKRRKYIAGVQTCMYVLQALHLDVTFRCYIYVLQLRFTFYSYVLHLDVTLCKRIFGFLNRIYMYS